MPHETQTSNVKDVYQQIHLKLNQITELSFPQSIEEYLAKMDKKGIKKNKNTAVVNLKSNKT